MKKIVSQNYKKGEKKNKNINNNFEIQKAIPFTDTTLLATYTLHF